MNHETQQATRPKGKSIYEMLQQVVFSQDTIIMMLNAGLTKEATKQLIKLNEQIRGFK
jgi:hypothetical protein